MAEAPGHRLGQIIGDTLEAAFEPPLRDFAREHKLYLDLLGPRPAREGRKVTWTDNLGNSHDLDFVLERGGSPDFVGTPAAFIETAWRRYTKHSRAKAQEIQGAILPLVSKWAEVRPFSGAIVAGNWTQGALDQLRSSGFAVLHIDYSEVVMTFAAFGMRIHAEEDTPDSALQAQVDTYAGLGVEQRGELARTLRQCARSRHDEFMEALTASVVRSVSRVVVLPLSGQAVEFSGIDDAVRALSDGQLMSSSGELVRFEVMIRFSNGDNIEAKFRLAEDAADFLRTFR